MTLERRTPLRSRSRKRPARKRSETSPCTWSNRCSSRVEVRVSDVERYCGKHATLAADREAREFVRARDPVCVRCGDGSRGVQWAHVHSRGMRFIRWDADNAVGLCSGDHYAYTHRPAAWVKFVESRWPGLYVRLVWRELYLDHVGGSVDVAEVIRTYRRGEPYNTPDAPADFRNRETRTPSDA